LPPPTASSTPTNGTSTLNPTSLSHQSGPPPGYDWEERDMSDVSTTTAFKAGVNQRDAFLGQRLCIICGLTTDANLRPCHIIRDSELDPLVQCSKARRWIPSRAKTYPQHEPRNGLLMCPNHRVAFNDIFFLHTFPSRCSEVCASQLFHNVRAICKNFTGKAIALDIRDYLCSFPIPVYSP
ncbi:hypothetical protein FA13DRAFT_1834616, partial [Coprinellus micaceus]